MEHQGAEFFTHAQNIQELLSFTRSEADTRANLVDPVLRILGYVAVGDIRREVPIPSTKEFVDYELWVDGRRQALVEAKAVRHAITDQDAGQCVQYASVLGVPWCLITNGVVWHLYYAYATGPLSAKRVALVQLGETDETTAAWRVLSLMSKESLSQATPLSKLLIERVVRDDLRRPDSPAVLALRKAVRDRYREQVSSQAVVDLLRELGLADAGSLRDSPLSAPLSATLPRSSPKPSRRRSLPLASLIESGLLPPDAPLECRLYGVTHAARIRDGMIDLNGKLYDSPSAAAAALRDGKASNGWIIWKHKGEFLATIRERFASASTGTPSTNSSS